MSKPHSPADKKPLKDATIRKILDAHCILTTYYEYRLFALENSGGNDTKLIDVTNWSKKDIYDWLGY